MATRTTSRSSGGFSPATKRKLKFAAGFAVYFAAIWVLWDTPVVYPLKVFVVMLHEISHGLAAVATGGAIERIELTMDQGGACYCGGGNAFLTLSAGYLGSLAWGALLLLIAVGAAKRHRITLMAIGSLVAAVTVLYIRRPFGLIFGLVAGVALIAAARRLPPPANRAVLTVLGLTSCLYAILDIKSDIIDRPEAHSDAYMLSEMTGIPTVIWGFLWIAVAVAVSGLLVRRIWRRV
jgi:hypothetical protein